MSVVVAGWYWPIWRRTRRRLFWVAVVAVVAVVPACSGETHSVTGVQFRMLSPYCGPNAYQLRFSIDSVVVGNDTLRDGEVSAPFGTTPGPHRLDAKVTGGSFAGFSFDTLVTVPADTVFVQVVDIYCS